MYNPDAKHQFSPVEPKVFELEGDPRAVGNTSLVFHSGFAPGADGEFYF